ncbi:hypothetical protein JOF41_007363 [Saccharothrix coeruleofusca]|uniref:hypothetical protein n=1 Tax=Saccharothrix coeruleofusca TaxID=33919 RepID=UPI001AE15BBB|nr:hypothetical protein [Saccharothrix coeruleofusca]MBP2341109.1 hypothetical protein [Saccharothrix coeruleofusca]
MQWLAQDTDHDTQVLPLHDAIQHSMDDDCLCGPHSETVPRADGKGTNWLVIHHSLDGREYHEPPESE